jgi:ATP-dependent DNA ligase
MKATDPRPPMKFHETADFTPYVTDDEWWMQQKVDGVRAQLVACYDADHCFRGAFARASGGVPLKSTTALPTAERVLRGLFATLPEHPAHRGARGDIDAGYQLAFDGEIVGDTWYIFDFVAEGTAYTYKRRHAQLLEMFDMLPSHDRLVLLPTAKTSLEKLTLLDRVHTENLEGVIIKHVSSEYLFGTRTRTSLKYKVTKTADVVVMERDNRTGRSNSDGSALNASFGVYNSHGELVEIGNCSMIGKPDAQPGDVIEVKYLYAGKGNRLVQPSCLRVRDDKAPTECIDEQLVHVSKAVIDQL